MEVRDVPCQAEDFKAARLELTCLNLEDRRCFVPLAKCTGNLRRPAVRVEELMQAQLSRFLSYILTGQRSADLFEEAVGQDST